MASIIATPDVGGGRVRLDLSGGLVGDPVYVLRRDSDGSSLVRETSEGTVLWPSADQTLTLYDHEARQGEFTDYIVTDPDGLAIASTTLQLPVWGTWLKSPGRPFRNTRVYFASEDEITLEARRLVVDVQDSPQRVVFAQRRASESGAITLVTRDAEQARALRLLVSDGMPLMLDTPQSWDVPYRYISVGDITRARAFDFDGLGLDREARAWQLEGVVQIEPPQGVPVGDPGRTYGDLPTLFSSYVTIPATTATYEELALGEVM